MLIVVLTFLGFFLILADLLFIPGMVLLTIGSGMILYSVYLNFIENGLFWAALQLIACLAVVPKIITISLNRIALKTEMPKEDGYIGIPDMTHLIGKKGKAFSDLRPSGCIELEIEGQKELLDCISEGGFIEKGSFVQVLEQRGPSLVVVKS
ncbi:MAG: hypothetical protein KDC71_12915 [Acidobacteria bacterium]|nr:hypothetical protein [Acidobacteriota bacterium]